MAIFQSCENHCFCTPYSVGSSKHCAVLFRLNQMNPCRSFVMTLGTSSRSISCKKAVYLWALSEENAGKSIPKPFSANGIVAKPGRIVTLIRISPEERQRTIQKSIAIPLWLNELAEKEDIDISQVLQEALKKKCTSNNHHTKKRHVSYCPAAFSGTAVSVLTFVPFFIFLHQRSLRTLHISLIVQGETTHTPLLAACRICPSLLQISFRF